MLFDAFLKPKDWGNSLWKKKCFVTKLAIQFLSCIKHLKLIVNAIRQVARVATHHMTIQLITTQLQLCHNNFFSMQLPYDYNHNVMLTSFHPSIKIEHMALWRFFTIFLKYWYPLPSWLLVLDGFGLWHMAQSKVVTWHINWILESNIYMYLAR
jgi:hypothetical protein